MAVPAGGPASGDRLLVVEDDEPIGRQLADALRAQGYRVRWASDARAARAELDRGGVVDLVLLDIGLPDIDGTAFARELRAAHPDLVIVMLTARNEEIDVVLGLDAGADDYLTKPFRLTELLARVRAHLRRRGPGGGTGTGSLTVGDVTVDPATRRVTVGGAEVPLRPREFDLLATLVATAGQALTRETLMAEVWDANWFGSTKTLDMHISAVRRKLAAAGVVEEVITTLRGYGYRYEIDPTGPRVDAPTRR